MMETTAPFIAAEETLTKLNNSRKLLLKNQLHLNLNVRNNEIMDNIDRQVTKDKSCSEIVSKLKAKAAAVPAEVVQFKDDVSYVETMTVTTVPKKHLKQQQQQQQHELNKLDTKRTTRSSLTLSSKAGAAAAVAKSSLPSSSLLNSSPSALAKFNRIIDSTIPATVCYKSEQQQQQQHHQEEYEKQQKSGIGTLTDSDNRKIDFKTKYDVNVDVDFNVDVDVYDDVNVDSTHDNDDTNVDVINLVKERDEKYLEKKPTHDDLDDDNQIKRNDVHYLLKQLNSFSDIEEIEIVDMKQKRQQQPWHENKFSAAKTKESLTTTTAKAHYRVGDAGSGSRVGVGAAAVITHSPTATSLVIISPSSQSHKESRRMMRRFASLHQQQTEQQQHNQYQHQHEQQFPQKKRYYTLNASGGNLLELSGRHDPATDQHYLLHQFDDYLFESCHYLETNYFAANYRTAMIESSSHEFRPSTTTGTRSSPSATSSPRSYEVHEIELPSVICRAPPPPPSPTRRFHTQARLTSSGVQTEISASLFSTTTTTSTTPSGAAQSLVKSGSNCSDASACSYASSTEQRRRLPFLKCCYMPIDCWREKRRAANAATAKVDNSGGGASSSSTAAQQNIKNGGSRRKSSIEDAGRGGSQKQQQQKNTHTRKNDSAV